VFQRIPPDWERKVQKRAAKLEGQQMGGKTGGRPVRMEGALERKTQKKPEKG